MPFPPGADWRATIAVTPPLDGVLMCAPTHFEVKDEKNVFMRGQQGRVDRGLAEAQWRNLRGTYLRLGVDVHDLPPREGCEDMVFCANGAALLPAVGGGAEGVLSRMNHASRQAEVPVLARTLADLGLPCQALPDDVGTFEGHGDLLVVPGRRLALGGFGGRSRRAALQAVARLTGVPVVPLELVGEVFYHLDTCLAVLDEDTLLVHPPAFRRDALELLATLFPRRLLADPVEAREQLAVNAHALASGHVLLPAQAPRTAEVLARAGYLPVLVDLSEFHRSGGSVFCMRLDLPARRGPSA